MGRAAPGPVPGPLGPGWAAPRPPFPGLRSQQCFPVGTLGSSGTPRCQPSSSGHQGQEPGPSQGLLGSEQLLPAQGGIGRVPTTPGHTA